MPSFKTKKYAGVALAAFSMLFLSNAAGVLAGDPVPTISLSTPITAMAGKATTISASFAHFPDNGSVMCALYGSDGSAEGASPSGSELGAAGTVSADHVFETSGTYTVYMSCWSSLGGFSVSSPEQTVNVQPATATVAATVGTVSPSSGVTVGPNIEYSAAYAGFSGGVGSCSLFINDASVGTMSLSGGQASANGVATKIYKFSASGTYSVRVACGGSTPSVSGAAISLVVSYTDMTEPTVSLVTPATATAGTATVFSASYSDLGTGVGACTFHVDGAAVSNNVTRTGTPASGTASVSYVPTAAGTLSVGMTCSDGEGNVNTLVNRSVTVTAATVADTVQPTVGGVTPIVATAGSVTTFSAAYADNVSVSECYLTIDNGNPAVMTRTGGAMSGTATRAHTFATQGQALVVVRCIDAMGNAKASSVFVTINAGTNGADTSLPVVGVVTPVAASVNTAVTLSAPYADNVSVTACYLYVDGVNTGETGRSTSATSGSATKSHTFTTIGQHSARIECVDAAGNRGVGASATVNVAAAGSDVTVPTVGSVLPATATLNEAVLFSASYADAIGVTACYLYVDGVSAGSMSRSSSATSGSASMSYTFASSGSRAVRVECVDAAGNRGVGSSATVMVSAASVAGADVSSPIVGLVSPSTAVVNATTTYEVTFLDNVGVTACYLYADNVGVAVMTRSTGTGTTGVMAANYRFATNGSRSIRVECVDAAGNRGVGGTSTVVVGATAVTDTSVPVVSALVRTTAIVAGASNRYTVFVTDASAISACRLYVNGSIVATMSVANAGGQTYATAGADYAFPSVGSYALRVECTDAAGNRGVSPSETVSVAAAGAPTGPTANPSGTRISAVTPGAVGTGAATSYAVAYTSSAGVISCSLYLNGTYLGSMGLSGPSTNGQANYLHTFTSAGTYRLHAECIDDARARTVGPATNVAVSLDGGAQAGSSAAISRPLPGSLIKLVCPEGAASDHPCKAVYYYGFDGMRHAFPHERVFFTWFANFDTVVEVTDEAMSSIRLGRTVTYRPGVRLLKFRTVPRVYALTRGGVLRWVTSESAAATLYGADWAQRVDDIQDAFYTDYTFGANIDSASDYNAESERNTVTTIDANA